MAATLTTSVNFGLSAVYQKTIGLANVQSPVLRSLIATMQTGTGANQADLVFSESAKSISANYDVDLAGSLVDAFGATLTFLRVKALLLFADAGNTGNVIIGNAAANQFPFGFGAVAHTFAVRPGGVFIAYAPDVTAYAVTGGTGDILRFAPSAGTQLFDWAVVGASV